MNTRKNPFWLPNDIRDRNSWVVPGYTTQGKIGSGNPTNFYVQLTGQRDTESYEKIKKELNQEYMPLVNGSVAAPAEVRFFRSTVLKFIEDMKEIPDMDRRQQEFADLKKQLGEYAVVYVEKNLYRVALVQLKHYGRIEVFLIDEGRHNTVFCESLYPLSPTLVSFPKCAINCCLGGIPLTFLEKYLSEGMDGLGRPSIQHKFRQLVKNEKSPCVVHILHRPMDVPYTLVCVDLISGSTNVNRVIYDHAQTIKRSDEDI